MESKAVFILFRSSSVKMDKSKNDLQSLGIDMP